MTRNEIIERARTVLAEEFEIDVDTITPDASLKDTLGLDSLDHSGCCSISAAKFWYNINRT